MTYALKNSSSQTIWQDIENFEKPECPNNCPMCKTPALDQDGYFCEYCDIDIPNGFEFDQAIAAFNAAVEQESKSMELG